MLSARSRPISGPDVHHRACTLCEALCGLRIEIGADGGIVSIRGDDDDPLSRGHICPKGVALQDLQSDPDRIRRPLRRRPGSGDWEELGWDEALDEVAGRIRELRREHGADSLAIYLGNPNVHNLGALLFGPPLLRLLRTRNRFSATSVDQLPHHVAATEMFGHRLLLPVPDLDRTDHLLVLGANPLASNGSMMTAPGMRRRLNAIQERGGRLVVVDPRRTETARLADRHLFVRPGTDALLLLSLVAVLAEEDRIDLGGLGDLVDGVDELGELVADFPPERTASATGIAPDEVRRLARELADAPTAVVYGRFGLSTQEFGGLCQWLIVVLNLVTGNLDRPGGAMFPEPAIDLPSRTGPGRRGRWTSRVRGLPEIDGELPTAVLAEEMETPGEGRIRGLLTVAGNPVLSAPNGARLERALPDLDLMVAVDPYLNETTRHAHYVLPPTPPLEREHYDLVFHALAVRNTAKWSEPLFERPADARHDWEILAGLHARLEDRGLGAKLQHAAMRRLGPKGLVGLGIRFGPWGAGWNPLGRGLTLGKLEREPHGVDLGPLRPCLRRRLRTPDGRIRLVPDFYRDDLPRLRARLREWTAAAGNGGGHDGDHGVLELIGRRQVRSNNSWMHNVPRLMRGADRCTLLLHPDDAAARGLVDGDAAAVVSATGRIEVPVEVTDEVMPGVVSLPHGWGHDRPGVRMDVATASPGASLNDVTDDGAVDELTGNAALSGVRVRVERVSESGRAAGSGGATSGA